MADGAVHDHPSDQTRIALQIGCAERDWLSSLAKLHDRTLSAEARRAIRFYLANIDSADRALRKRGKR
jgi:hypothetical protein